MYTRAPESFHRTLRQPRGGLHIQIKMDRFSFWRVKTPKGLRLQEGSLRICLV
jgi:hypothetical protein